MPTIAITADHLFGLSLLVLAVLLVRIALRPMPPAEPAPPPRSGFTRWLTPMALPVLHASASATRALGVGPRARAARPSVPTTRIKLMASTGADPREIARRTGMARDAVAMMMARAPQGAAPVGRRSVRAAVAGSRPAEPVMRAPGRGDLDLRNGERDGKGTRFRAFVQ